MKRQVMRYRAVVVDGTEKGWRGQTLHPTPERALKEAIEMATKAGVVGAEPVEARREVRREWVEKVEKEE
jgi:hypothetical protein